MLYRIFRNTYFQRLLLLFVCIQLGCTSSDSSIQELDALKSSGIFTISDDKDAIILDGIITSSSFVDFKKLEKNYTHVRLIKIVNCYGSMDDEVNLQMGVYIHGKSFNMHLNDNGTIASGGTDLFLAGKNRTIGTNTRVGVHAWGGLDAVATDYPRGHKYHLPYIEYYKDIGFSQKESEDFYYFTIYAAPADGIHWMTKEEINKYNILKNTL